MSKVIPPKLKLEENSGFYHLFVGGVHNPEWCAECINPGLWPSIPAPSSTDRPIDPPKNFTLKEVPCTCRTAGKHWVANPIPSEDIVTEQDINNAIYGKILNKPSAPQEGVLEGKIICKTCGAKDVPDWNGEGECIKCARDKILNHGSAPIDFVGPLGLSKEDLLEMSDSSDKFIKSLAMGVRKNADMPIIADSPNITTVSKGGESVTFNKYFADYEVQMPDGSWTTIQALFNKALTAKLEELKEQAETRKVISPKMISIYNETFIPVSAIDELIERYKGVQ